MKDYLNKRERTQFLFFISLLNQVKENIDEMANHTADKTTLRYLRTGVTWMDKGLSEICKGVKQQTLDSILNEAGRVTTALVFRKDAEAHTRTMLETDREMRQKVLAEIGYDPIMDMADLVLLSCCKKCDGTPHQTAKGCWIHDTLKKLNIPEWDLENTKCDYAGSGAV